MRRLLALFALLALAPTLALAGSNGQGVSINGSLVLGNAIGPATITANALPPTTATTNILDVVGADAAASRLVLDSFGGNPVWLTRRADTSNVSRSAVQSAETIGTLSFQGYGSTTYVGGGVINFFAAQNFTDSAAGTNFTINLTKASTTTSGVVLGIDNVGHTQLGLSGTVPTITSCGSSPSTARGTDVAGEVTEGTTATGCTISFATAYTTAPFCVVSLQTQQAAFTYTISTSAITVTNTSATGDKINWICSGQ